MKKILLTCCALAIGAIAGPTMAKDVEEYAVNEIKYKNRGAYIVESVEIRYNINTNSGNTVTCRMAGNKFRKELFEKSTDIQSGQERSFNLRNRKQFFHDPKNLSACVDLVDDENSDFIPIGSEIRVFIYIDTGDMKKCRKKDRVKFYYHPEGGNVNYVTKGTTFNNNRCQIQSKGGVFWKDVQ